jgi:REP element-mobilizing transposase RayT
MASSAPREKHHRLPPAAYSGLRRVAFTACTAHRAPIFAAAEPAQGFAGILLSCAERHCCDVVVYCFMPDHLHAVMAGRTRASNCKHAFEAFKYESGLWLARHGAIGAWQKDYHDHILRESEDWLSYARYILGNPVRAGLVATGYEYAGSGSSLYSVRDLVDGLV